MKFNINRPPKYVRREERRNQQQIWHPKFAWWPTFVDETRSGRSIVWFENYMRKGTYGPTSPNSRGDGFHFKKLSSKTYFKKQLEGEEKDSVQEEPRGTASNIINTSFTPSYTKLIHDSTDMKISTAVEKIKQQAIHRKHNK